MKSNSEYRWNETLKFSWGHIIAFVAIIFISYVAYMGKFYMSGGDFASAAKRVGLIVLVVLAAFMGAQVAKASDAHFDRSIVIERILVVLCPIVLGWAMVPCNHFWNVFAVRDRLETQFAESISNSSKMFDDYVAYSGARIQSYERHLCDNNVLPYTDKEVAAVVRGNYVETLRLQLLSQNTDSLISLARTWIKDANQGASVWNSFLVGNVDVITDAMEGWNKKLFEVSVPVLSNEPNGVVPFDSNHESFKAAIGSLKELKEIYTIPKGLNINTVWTFVILFFMLMFPYFLQERCTRASGFYTLWTNIFRKGAAKGVARGREASAAKADGKSDNGQDSDDLFNGTI